MTLTCKYPAWRYLQDGHPANSYGQLHRQHPPTPQNRPLQRLEIPVIEALPDVTREAIERATVSCAQQAHTSTRRQPAAR